MIKNVYNCLHVKWPLFFSDFNEFFNFLDILSKNHQISNFMKIRRVGAEFFHFDERTDGLTDIQKPGGRTDMTKLIVALRNFANAPKISCVACDYYTTVEQLLTVPGTDPRMPFRIVICTVNEVHSAAHNQSSTQNYVQDKIKMLRKSSFVVFPYLLIRHKKKPNFESYSNFSYRR